MDWQLAIEKNREALMGILAMVAAMVGIADFRSADNRPATLPRHRHRSILRLLRPAEAAARRLIIVAARGLVVEPPTARVAEPAQAVQQGAPGVAMLARGSKVGRRLPRRRETLSLPMFDPLKRWGRRRHVPRRSEPRITFDFDRPRDPGPPPLTPDDPLDARRLCRRFEAIDRALNDLPRQAKRFARWQAGRDAELAGGGEADGAGHLPYVEGASDEAAERGEQRRAPRAEAHGAAAAQRKWRRLSPLRPGRPPGWRRRPGHAVDAVLNDLHGLAFWALERRDTS